MKLAFSVIALFVGLVFTSVISHAITTSTATAHANTVSHISQNDEYALIQTIETAVSSYFANQTTNAAILPPDTLNGYLLLGTRHVQWVIQQTANRDTSTAMISPQVGVYGGGAQRTDQYNNTGVVLNDDGTPGQENIQTDVVYRLYVIDTATNMIAPGTLEVQILGSVPPTITIPAIKFDAGNLSNGSVGFSDTLCGSLATNGCVAGPFGQSTTVVQAEHLCFWSSAPGVGSTCQPLGQATAAPQSLNVYSQTTTNDGSNGE